MSYASNIAHIKVVSGTLVMPAHSPYDRQLLRENVERLADRVPALSLGLHGTEWTITPRPAEGSRCTACAQSLSRLSCSRGDAAVMTCIECAMQPEGHQTTDRRDS